jgi:response regulator RpfG family c-di-GMP phosphodiesterase
VANYAVELAKRLGKSEEEQNMIFYAGLLHDVGKIRVKEEVLNKPGKLTKEEFEQIKIHTVSGYHILKDIYDDPQMALGAKYHHERYNGEGYPDGLSGENIPEVARIIGVADAYDAMSTKRGYRDPLPQETIRKEIENGRGSQFDPQIADIMLQMIAEDKDYQMRELVDTQKNILMIDDDGFNIKTVKRIMQEEPQYCVIGAENFADAQEILKEGKIDLVLLDLLMPDIEGFEAFKKIREMSDVPIIFITADKNIETIRKAMELGAADYATKPFLPIALKERIHGVIYSI